MHSDVVEKGELLTDWSYYVLRPRGTRPKERGRLSLAYECWKDAWGAMLRRLDNTELSFADDFSRQDEIGALFDGDECIGLSGYRWLDLSLAFNRADSYFAPWPLDALDAIARSSPRVCVGSNLVVSSVGHGRMGAVKVSEALLALAVRRFQESNAQVLLGTMRNDRSMNAHAYRLKARALAHDVYSHNVLVDLVVFDRDAVSDIGLPPIRWIAPPFSIEDEPHDENVERVRRAAG